jgi:hypothetical protein
MTVKDIGRTSTDRIEKCIECQYLKRDNEEHCVICCSVNNCKKCCEKISKMDEVINNACGYD